MSDPFAECRFAKKWLSKAGIAQKAQMLDILFAEKASRIAKCMIRHMDAVDGQIADDREVAPGKRKREESEERPAKRTPRPHKPCLPESVSVDVHLDG